MMCCNSGGKKVVGRIVMAVLMALLILTPRAVQAGPTGPGSVAFDLSKELCRQSLSATPQRVMSPQIRVADLQKNMFSPSPPVGQTQEAVDSPQRGKISHEVANKQSVPTYNLASPKPGGLGYPVVRYPSAWKLGKSIPQSGINLGGPIIKDKLWFFGSWGAHEIGKRGTGDQRVWNAYRENPPTKIYAYRQQTVPDLTSLQDLEITRNGVQKPGFELFPRVNGTIRVVTKNGITRFGGLSFGENNLPRTIQEKGAVTPNDPYYMKGGSAVRKGLSKLAVGIGGLLKIGGFAIGVGTGTGGDNVVDQWGLRAVGFTPLDDPASAWRLEDGTEKNVIVAVIDSGLDMAHPDGPRYVWANPGEIPGNGIDDDANGFVDDINGWNFAYENNDLTDDNGHGTFVAGIIAAKTNNGMGIAGINPGAQIMVLKVADRDGRCQSLNIFRALRYAANHGASVINISLGAEGKSRLEQLGVNYAHYCGAVVVVAAGNQAGDITQYGPPGLRKVFSVAATKMDGTKKGNSNFGARVALTAPGEGIYSLTSKDGRHDGRITPIAPTQYHQLSGTSFAAPFVAGVASLMRARNPELTNTEVENIIMATARDMDAKGWDRYTGAGLLNAAGALKGSTGGGVSARITEILINREGEKFVSADLYGTVQGDLERYTVEVGKGKKPGKWKRVYGPSPETVVDGHICRIGGGVIDKKGEWVIRIRARDRSGGVRLLEMPFFTEGQRAPTVSDYF